jgi:hypothetical protein
MDHCGIKVVHRSSLKKDRVYSPCNIFGRYCQLLGKEALDTAADKCLDYESSLEYLAETGKLRILYYKMKWYERTIRKILSLKTGHGYDPCLFI